MSTIKILVATSAAFFSAASLSHSGLEQGSLALAQGSLLTGLMHPLTGLDHVFTLLLLGGAISLLCSGEKRQIKRSLAGAATLGILLSWSFLHYSGSYFVTYALGFACTSSLLMITGVSIAGFGQRLKTARARPTDQHR